ncbi:hypothetical protein N7453_005601 [Penicillium expansum]|nr:hypothetical protein N7453_005601 [Penicillium expansum]
MDAPRRSMESKVAQFRASSPSPSIPATPAISSYSSTDRTFSSESSRSTSSATSADARSSVSTSSRRHGYTRALGAEFSESARHRDSVMSLGSIAHLQYYFARTGLLDGKSGRGREWEKGKKNKNNVPRVLITPNQRHMDDDMVMSPTDMADPVEGEFEDEEAEVMLPPTVSTYSIKTHHIPPPPDLLFLRRQLLLALDKAETNIEAIQNGAEPPPAQSSGRVFLREEAQGMCILDDVTNAIRAAKIYYTSHENSERLATIKSEREIRKELLDVLEVLKRWAARHFASGLREEERGRIQGWFVAVRTMISREKALEELEAQERQNWDWAAGDWRGRERSREESFLRSLLPGGDSLPTWFRDGRALVQLHNLAIKKSKRQFGEITAYHLDIAKPYRQTENLQFWVKAAQLRWELRLDVDVMGVVQNSGTTAWEKFDTALLAWCKTVREELVRDWQAANPGRPPSAGLI